MFDRLARMFLGSAVADAPLLTPDIAGLETPGRPPQWIAHGVGKSRSINGKAACVEPFFNHVAGDTRFKRAA
ncbi:MAG: hypothetical protein B7Y80_07685 [Hyphomicrobium sp. 32-62-53]|nr:MAG: hypothetical protein B7Z29_03835 [Hyphomicrobium sp. 12-62-95]OYY00484.1 MAG: hypothetical protein B7Y80_07685 [Hyphomicrobium sp. 32-62-53]